MNIRDVIGRINFIGNQKAVAKDARRIVTGISALGRKGPAALAEQMKGIFAIEEEMNRELDRWKEPEELADGDRFDVCDLRIWLKLAEEAGVPFVPGKVILSIGEDDLSALLRPVAVPDVPLNRARDHLAKAFRSDAELEALLDGPPHMAALEAGEDVEQRLHELHEAMSSRLDEIPASWMVRTHVGGASNLKALVGTGLMLKGDDVAEIAPGVKLGAGWAQVGNRRMIDFADHRFVSLGAQGHKPVTHYIARPWETPARFHEGEDLHRANSPLAGPGRWPAEWRVFVRNGSVTGVANYYGWTGEGATPENAWNALEAAGLGQRIADHAVGRGVVGVFMDQHFLRQRAETDPQAAAALEGWDAEGFHATIDFIETQDGLKLLEGGPAHAPGGGGHPCAFAGQGVDRDDVTRWTARCEGVAFLPMAHVHLGEPGTWVDGDPEGRILDWPDVIALAAQHGAPTAAGQAFAARFDDGTTLEP
ncbi:hypothetical protein LAZ40_03275 [Cereibacter sphaeroides]|uniref:hypothetical protein n=1 Tax=Cereibacter sphaeroides TaxID=1063 RepID=UPI001F29A31A|nr:hypothetical protein [Cereibacter sphaeroides]MCE6958077.1 hypothetical protein [Cereibacter sphaeroides]MCE6971312.1 hypothetical protein [Cereibacter sphaeroides]